MEIHQLRYFVAGGGGARASIATFSQPTKSACQRHNATDSATDRSWA